MLLCRPSICVKFNFSTYYLLPTRPLPCAKLVLVKKKLSFLLDSILGRVRQSSQLCKLLLQLCFLSSVYTVEAKQVASESSSPNPSLFHIRYSAPGCSTSVRVQAGLCISPLSSMADHVSSGYWQYIPRGSVSLRTPLQMKENV